MALPTVAGSQETQALVTGDASFIGYHLVEPYGYDGTGLETMRAPRNRRIGRERSY